MEEPPQLTARTQPEEKHSHTDATDATPGPQVKKSKECRRQCSKQPPATGPPQPYGTRRDPLQGHVWTFKDPCPLKYFWLQTTSQKRTKNFRLKPVLIAGHIPKQLQTIPGIAPRDGNHAPRKAKQQGSVGGCCCLSAAL